MMSTLHVLMRLVELLFSFPVWVILGAILGEFAVFVWLSLESIYHLRLLRDLSHRKDIIRHSKEVEVKLANAKYHESRANEKYQQAKETAAKKAAELAEKQKRIQQEWHELEENSAMYDGMQAAIPFEIQKDTLTHLGQLLQKTQDPFLKEMKPYLPDLFIIGNYSLGKDIRSLLQTEFMNAPNEQVALSTYDWLMKGKLQPLLGAYIVYANFSGY